MKKNLNEELKDIKYLFNYDRGRVISEQNMFEDDDQEEFDTSIEDEDMEEFDTSMDYDDDQEEFDTSMNDMELDEEMDVPVMLPGTKEKERTITTPGIKPGTKPGTPYRPKPGPKKNPKAEEKEMPTWLTFNKIGIKLK